MNVIDNIVRARNAVKTIQHAAACMMEAHPELGQDNAVSACVDSLAVHILDDLKEVERFVNATGDEPLKPTVPGTVRELRQALAGLPDDLPIGFTASDTGRFRFGHEHPNNGIKIWRNQGDELESADVILEPVFTSVSAIDATLAPPFDTGPVTADAQA